MPKVVEVPGIGNIEFPDSMNDADISAAISKQLGGQGSGEPKSVGGFLSNALTSTGNLVGQTVSAITHPVQTLQAVGSIPLGLYEKAGGTLPAPGPGQIDAAKQLDAMIDHFKQRYGSLDKAKETLYSDPAGFLGDLSVVTGGAGAALRGTGAIADVAGAARTAAALGETGKTLGTISDVTNPLVLGSKAAGAIAGPVATGTANALRRGALRGGYTVNTPAADVADAVTAMRQEGVPFSQSGLDKVSAALQDYQQQKQALVQPAAAAGKTVPRQEILDELNRVRDRFASQINPAADLKQIDNLIADVQTRYPTQIPVDIAEQLKEGTYRTNKWANAPPEFQATAAAEKAAALALKDELEARIPELATLNAKQAKLLDLEGILKTALNKYQVGGGFTGNLSSQMLGPKGLSIGGGAGALTGTLTHSGPVGAAAGVGANFLNALLSDPQIRTRLAMGINFAQQADPAKWGAPQMGTALSRVDAYRNSLATQ